MPSSTVRACSCGRQGREQRACEVDILRPTGARYRNWRVATAMRRAGAPAYGFGTLSCGGLRRADRPSGRDGRVHARHLQGVRRAARHRHHRQAATPTSSACAAISRPCASGRSACSESLRPMDRYVFLVTALGEGYGGLEHRASTALLCSREDLPRARREGGHRELPHLPGPVQPRVLPHLERQAHQACRLHTLRSRRARTTPRCCGPSKASPATTTTSPWCAAA